MCTHICITIAYVKARAPRKASRTHLLITQDELFHLKYACGARHLTHVKYE